MKLYRGFTHPANDKVLKFLRLARPAGSNSETATSLNDVSAACKNCQHYGPAPIRFKASIPSEENLVFGNEISVNLMFLDGKALLHVVYTAARFSAATFLDPHGSSCGQIAE